MARMNAISAMRKADQANGWTKMKFARSLIRQAMEWKPTEKGRKRSAAEANNASVESAVLKQKVRVVVIDE